MAQRAPPDADIDRVRRLARADHGLAVVATSRPDGSIQCSVVNAGVMEHPVSRLPVVAFVSIGSAARLRYLRRAPQATVVFRAGWEWVAVEGVVGLAGPEDSFPGISPEEIPRLLRDIFTAAGGSHDNWEEYDRVMAEERRTAVFVAMERIYPNR
jgi:PPOX class probable F420-dependent enzyme